MKLKFLLDAPSKFISVFHITTLCEAEKALMGKQEFCSVVEITEIYYPTFLVKLSWKLFFTKGIAKQSIWRNIFTAKVNFWFYSVWQLNVQILVLIVLPNSRFTFLWTGWTDFQNSNAGWSIWPCSMLNNFYKSIHQRRAEQKYSESGLALTLAILKSA